MGGGRERKADPHPPPPVQASFIHLLLFSFAVLTIRPTHGLTLEEEPANQAKEISLPGEVWSCQVPPPLVFKSAEKIHLLFCRNPCKGRGGGSKGGKAQARLSDPHPAEGSVSLSAQAVAEGGAHQGRAAKKQKGGGGLGTGGVPLRQGEGEGEGGGCTSGRKQLFRGWGGGPKAAASRKGSLSLSRGGRAGRVPYT